MVADLVVADCKLLAELQVSIGDRFVIQLAEDEPLFFIARFHEHPHPLASAKLLVFNLDLHVVALREFSHCHNLSMKTIKLSFGESKAASVRTRTKILALEQILKRVSCRPPARSLPLSA